MKLIAGGLLEQEGKFLLVNAKVGVPKGKWNLPAGHIDEGETIDEAACREVKEETGFDVTIEGLIGVYQRIAKTLPDGNVVRVNFKMKIIGGELTPQEDEIEKTEWFTLEQIKTMPDDKIAFGTAETVLDYVSRGCIKQSFFSTRKEQI